VFIEAITAFALTAIWLLVLAPFARRFGIVDRPDARKQHKGEIPLIGGLAIFVSIVTLLPLFSSLDANLLWYLSASALLVLSGVLDDRYHIGVGLRVGVEILAALMMILGAGLWVGNLGNLLGFGDIHMPRWLAAPFTIIAVFGITNAWNMIDGMDGIVGTVTLIVLGGFYFLTSGAAANNALTSLLIGATGAFLLFNICSNRLLPKVFLGDAGSKFIGFSLVWLLIDGTQGGKLTGMHMPAVLALFVVGLPLIDMVATTIRRVRKGQGVFSPDRTHVHHILQHAGFTHQEILLLIALAASLVNLIGGLMYVLDWPAWLMFGVFWLVTFAYFHYIDHAAKLARLLLPEHK
jgi:UDP-GlcNAc:undecaprenyl-phosphate/decaprenyl-phosphate GlcNAc-1-phosphate transferase